MDAIAAYDLTKEYGGLAVLEGINLQVPQGMAFACVGEKGCGKTTLVRLLSGLARPTTGECTVMGLSPVYEPQKLHSVAGTVLDSARLYQGMSLYENLRFFAGLHGLDENDALERSSFLLHKLDIWEARDLPVGSLPTGVLRRASLARALMHSPQILLVDEPAGGLDQETAAAIQELLASVEEEEGVTLFLCSSNMGYAQLLCKEFAILHQGVLLARGGLESLRQGAGVGYRAQLRLGGTSPAPKGFMKVDGLWEREIASEADMSKIIAQAVGEGLNLYEARLLCPTLKEIYNAWLEGGIRKVVEPYGAESESREEGEFWKPGEELAEESGGEILGPGGPGEFPGESGFGAETAPEAVPEKSLGKEI